MNYLKLDFNIREKDVRINDTIKYSTVLDYFQDIAGMQSDLENIGFTEIVKKGYYWILLYVKFEVVGKLPKFGDHVDVITWPKAHGKIEYEREYEIRNKNGDLIIKGISNWCLIDAKTRMLKRAEIEYRGELYPYTNYNEKCKRKLNLKEHDVIDEYKYKILINDLDHNMHMNNARYLDIIYNMGIDTTKAYKKLEIAFLHEAKLNEEVIVKYYKEDNINNFIGYLGDEKSFEVSIEYED